MKHIFVSIISYLFGSINPAYIFGKMKGFDIRERGTGNAGASNAKICLGWKYFVICAAFDISKASMMVLAVRHLLEADELLQIISGCFVIIGHCFPFYLNFKGGKGFAAYIGLILAINWKIFAAITISALILSLICNYIVFATLILCIFVPIVAYISKMSYSCIISLFLISLLVLFQHRHNFTKFFHGEEIGINGKTIGIKI